MKNKIYILIFSFFLFFKIGKTQDIHYAQFHNAILYQSPALTGVMSGDYRLNGIYRMQWESVPVQYRTFSLGYDMKILEQKNGVLGVGILLNRDKAGDSELSLTSATVSVAYTIKLGEKSLATLGVNVGGVQRSFNYNNLTFDSQFNGDIFVPTSSTGETFNKTNFFYLDMGAGLNYRFQSNKRTQFDLGITGFHFNQPQQTFREDTDSKLPIRLSAYFNSSFKINQKSDILLRALIHKQLTYSEYGIGAGWRYHLSEKKSKEMAIAFSAHYRLNDAVIPMIELEYAAWKFGLSYDVNISNFNIATNYRGGPELSVIYIITKVKPLPEYKACPIF